MVPSPPDTASPPSLGSSIATDAAAMLSLVDLVTSLLNLGAEKEGLMAEGTVTGTIVLAGANAMTEHGAVDAERRTNKAFILYVGTIVIE